MYSFYRHFSRVQAVVAEKVEPIRSPVFTHAAENEIYRKNLEELKLLEILEYEYCNKPQLLGQGHHIVIVAKKIRTNQVSTNSIISMLS